MSEKVVVWDCPREKGHFRDHACGVKLWLMTEFTATHPNSQGFVPFQENLPASYLKCKSVKKMDYSEIHNLLKFGFRTLALCSDTLCHGRDMCYGLPQAAGINQKKGSLLVKKEHSVWQKRGGGGAWKPKNMFLRYYCCS